MQRTSRALFACLIAVLAACTAQQSERREAPEPEMTVRGSLAFRDGVTPPPGSVVTVSITDFAADSPAPVATLTIRIEDPAVLLPFELRAPSSSFALERQYVVTADVSSPQDQTRWSTDVAQIIDTTREDADVGVLLMRQSRSPAQDSDHR